MEVGGNYFQSVGAAGKDQVLEPVTQINSSARSETTKINDRKNSAKVSGKVMERACCNRNSSTVNPFATLSPCEVLGMILGFTSILTGVKLEWVAPLAPIIRPKYHSYRNKIGKRIMTGSRAIKADNGESVRIQVNFTEEFGTSPVPLLVTAGCIEDRLDGITQHPNFFIKPINGKPNDKVSLENVDWAYSFDTATGSGEIINMEFEIYRPTKHDDLEKHKRRSKLIQESRVVFRVYTLQRTASGFDATCYDQLLSDTIIVGQQQPPKLKHINHIEWNCGEKFQLAGNNLKSKKTLPDVSVSLEYLGTDFGKIDASISHEDTKNTRLTFTMPPSHCGANAKVNVTVTVDGKPASAIFDVSRGEGPDAALCFQRCEVHKKAGSARKRRSATSTYNVKIKQNPCPSALTAAQAQQMEDFRLTESVLNGGDSFIGSTQDQPLTADPSVYHWDNIQTAQVQQLQYWQPETAQQYSLTEVSGNSTGNYDIEPLTPAIDSLPETLSNDLNMVKSSSNNAQDGVEIDVTVISRQMKDGDGMREMSHQLQEMKDMLTCVICLDRKRNMAFLCGHSACNECAQVLRQCHMCRKLITMRINLFN